MIKVWILTAFFGFTDSGITTEQYLFKTREECVAGQQFYSDQKAGRWFGQKPTCYPSYVVTK